LPCAIPYPVFTLWLFLLRALLAGFGYAVYLAAHGQPPLPPGVPVPGPIFAAVAGVVIAGLWLVSELLARNPPPPDIEAQLQAAYEGRPYLPELEVRPPPEEAAKKAAPPPKK